MQVTALVAHKFNDLDLVSHKINLSYVFLKETLISCLEHGINRIVIVYSSHLEEESKECVNVLMSTYPNLSSLLIQVEGEQGLDFYYKQFRPHATKEDKKHNILFLRSGCILLPEIVTYLNYNKNCLANVYLTVSEYKVLSNVARIATMVNVKNLLTIPLDIEKSVYGSILTYKKYKKYVKCTVPIKVNIQLHDYLLDLQDASNINTASAPVLLFRVIEPDRELEERRELLYHHTMIQAKSVLNVLDRYLGVV